MVTFFGVLFTKALGSVPSAFVNSGLIWQYQFDLNSNLKNVKKNGISLSSMVILNMIWVNLTQI